MLSPERLRELKSIVKSQGGTYEDFKNMVSSQERMEKGIQEERISTMQQESPVLSAMFPRGVVQESQQDGQGALGGAVGDLLSLPGRAIASGGDITGQGQGSMRDIKGQGIVQNILRNPGVGAGVMMAPALGVGLTAGLVEGGTIAGVNQLSNIGEDKDVLGAEIMTDLASSLAFPGFAQVFKTFKPQIKTAILKKAGEFRPTKLESFMSQLSGASAEALNVASTAKGRRDLIKYADKFSDIGKGVLNVLESPDQYYPKENALKLALETMPDMNVKSVYDKLEASHKSLGNSAPELVAKGKILKDLRWLKKDYATVTPSFGPYGEKTGEKLVWNDIPATDYRTFRTKIDGLVDYSKDRGADKYNDLIRDARTVAKDELIKKSAGTDYEPVMKEYFDFLKVRGDIYKNYALGTPSKTGAISETAEIKLGNVLRNLYNTNNKEKARFLQRLDDMMGSDFTKQTKLASLSKSIVVDGGIPIFPTQWTGRSGLGPTVGRMVESVPIVGPAVSSVMAGASSPYLSSRILGATQGQDLGRIGTGLGLAGDILSNPYLQRTVPGLARIPLQQSFTQGDQ